MNILKQKLFYHATRSRTLTIFFTCFLALNSFAQKSIDHISLDFLNWNIKAAKNSKEVPPEHRANIRVVAWDSTDLEFLIPDSLSFQKGMVASLKHLDTISSKEDFKCI